MNQEARLPMSTENTSAPRHDAAAALQTIQVEVGGCRDWPPNAANRCGKPAEYLLWGKLLKPEALGPRCADCAALHVGWEMLRDPDCAIVNLRTLAARLAT
jgi:hypothetical protein